MRAKILSIFVVLSLLLFAPAYGSAKETTDSNYIKLYPDQFTVRMYLGEKVTAFDLVDERTEHSLQYRPNNALGLGLGVTVRGVGLNFSTRLPFHDAKDEKFGRTRKYDLQVHRYRGKLSIDGYAQRYKGFHLNSNEDVYAAPSTTAYPYLENLTTLNIGATVLYLFNGNKFSLRGTVNQQDRQQRSAGSWMVGATFFSRYIFNNESLIPTNYKHPEVFEGDSLRHIGNYGLLIGGGYGYNLVFGKHFFAGISADVGAGPGYSIVRNTADKERSKIGFTIASNLRAGLGYNTNKWFGGIYAVAHGERYALPYSQSKVNTAQGIVRLVVARRFTTHKKTLKSSTH